MLGLRLCRRIVGDEEISLGYGAKKYRNPRIRAPTNKRRLRRFLKQE
jgi:hypothetical protein